MHSLHSVFLHQQNLLVAKSSCQATLSRHLVAVIGVLAQANYSYPILHFVVHDSHRCCIAALAKQQPSSNKIVKRLVKRTKALPSLLVAQSSFSVLREKFIPDWRTAPAL